ncbi:MAG: hypothetical protein OHK0057_25100 [Thermoflexibacter sp.]
MSNKIKILLGIILVEIMAIAFSISTQSKQTSMNDNSLQQFALLDSTGVHRFIFGKNTLERNEIGTWIVNQKYTADAPLIRQLFQVLAKIEIKKPVSDNVKKEIAEQFQTQGIDIQILKEGKTVHSFKMLDRERECIVQKPDGEAYVIYVPGYNISLSEVFKLSEGDWRAKTVISSSFFGVKKIALTYTEKPQESFVIERDSTFFKVQGISKLDSNMVGNYVDAYKNIRVFSFLDKPAMKDSLLKTQPYCIIEVEDIDKSKNNSIKVFTDKKQLFGILGKTEELVELEPRYFTRFFVRKKDFAK